MSVPNTWFAPTSGGTVGGTSPSGINGSLSYAGGYWFAITHDSATGSAYIRYATDPTGAWGSATMPAPPTSYAWATGPSSYPVSYNGGTYAFVMRATLTSLQKWRLIYATDPTGSWTAHEFDATDTYINLSPLTYANSTWVLAGKTPTTGTNLPAIGTASSITGTWSWTTGSNTGYTGTGWGISDISYDGTYWVSSALSSGGSYGHRYSTALLSSWSTASVPSGATRLAGRQDNGYWMVIGPTTSTYYYATDPSSTWGSVTAASAGVSPNLGQLAWGANAWVSGPNGGTAHLWSYDSAGSPSGTYTQITADGFTAGTVRTLSLLHAANHWVGLVDVAQELRYAATLIGPTYLRQRQSPVRSPSRVRPTDLRQRQSPYTT